MSTVRITNVTKAFGDNVVLKAFSDEFEDGKFYTLLGPSGCGKTTMLRIIAGFETPTSGEVYIGDKLVSGGKTFLPPEKRDIGMVFQSYAVWPHMNVFDNVAYPLKIKRAASADVKTRTDRVLSIVHLAQYAARFPNQLSGGQQQRVALARALVAQPKLLLLDEPLSNLDAKLRESMRFEIKDIQTQLGITVVYVTHDQTEAMAMSDRILVINRGVVQQTGTPEYIYNNPANPFVADFVGKVEFLRGAASGGVVTLDNTDQKLRCGDSRKGKVIVAIRPETVKFTAPDKGDLRGTLTNRFFLGDICDCRVKLSDKVLLRVIADPVLAEHIAAGDSVGLAVRSLMVFEDDGEDRLEILT
ncbi:MAG: ABC transporter ATP-binding protein [Oscillospiraceae bacterium]|jgi:iron(III) transport system ATP-binding protein|nr:ABC transporter ATP-binding protein [Oscillospiraceae bacterium]